MDNQTPESDASRKKASRRFRQFRFGLRSVFAAIFLAAIGMFWLSSLYLRARKERLIVESLREKIPGIGVQYDFELDENFEVIPDARPPGPLWLRRMFDDKMFAKVRKICVTGDSDLSDIKLARDLSGLKSVYLYELKIKDLDCLKELRQIEGLEIIFCSQLNDVSAVSSLNMLNTVAITFSEIEDITPIAQLPELERFIFTSGAKTDLSPLSKMVELKHLHISHDSRIRDLSFLDFMPRIERLGLAVLNSLQGVEEIRDKQNISEFSIARCPNISDLSPVWTLKRLKILRIEDCPGVKEVPDGIRLGKLEELTINKLDREFEDQLILSAPHLRKLVIGSSHLSDGTIKRTSLETIVSLNELTEIELYGLPRLIDIQTLGQLPRLEKVLLYQCTAVTKAEIQKLQQVSPRLKIIVR